MTAHEDDSQLTLVVANTGEPPSAEILAHLFEPFVSGREGGHGLGLWVSYQTINQLGGRIAVECRAGEVRFMIHLPLQGDAFARSANVGTGGTAHTEGYPT